MFLTSWKEVHHPNPCATCLLPCSFCCACHVSLWVATGEVPARFALLEFDPAMLDNVGTVWLNRGVTEGELELLEEEELTVGSRSFEEFEGEEVVGCFEVIRGCFEEEEPELADDCFAEDELDG